jgi:broad specificity polyphosphatase/5'/3'-nucleotidase SurE
MAKGEHLSEGSDALALAHERVSITPLSLDLTSRTGLEELRILLGDT